MFGIVCTEANCTLDSSPNHEGSLIGAWIRDLETSYPISHTKDVLPDDQFSEIRGRGVEDFQRALSVMKTKISDAKISDAVVRDQPPSVPLGEESFFESIFDADSSVVLWAIRVVNFESFARPDPEEPKLKRLCMYMCPWGMEQEFMRWEAEYDYADRERTETAVYPYEH